ncbi:MAG: DUF507 family protein [Deltaproteobacteria bacterium]|nr:DUF507 family protein [Deltaproteobacteria bacterium]MBW2015625.1 DUF507 family protein [Deltaproteobacteria bacterium]MBW2129770.1 DUF507 family protein [Deltaproteobacteria bacterium]MBW2302486.1 DUF507 family protein [Deltaproteobacteria bacterium]
MRRFDSGRVQDKLLNRLERKEKQEAFQRDRFFKFKLPEIQSRLTQALLMEKIVETSNPGALSELLGQGLKKYLRINEFDYKYFTAPIRNLIPRPNPISLFLTQYILEVVINDPNVVDVYGTDIEIYKTVNNVVTQINLKFERTENEILQHLARNKALTPGSKDYDIALEQLFRKKMGDPQQG